MGASLPLRLTLLVCRVVTLVVSRRFITETDMVLGQALWHDLSLDTLPPDTFTARTEITARPSSGVNVRFGSKADMH
jgi:hypothetical protein